MAVIEILVNGKKRNLYVDGRLLRTIQQRIKPLVQKKDFDWVWIVDGPEGSGKSVFAQQLAMAVDPDFNIDRMCLTVEQFTRTVTNAKKGQCVVFDEAFTGLSSRQSLGEINKLIVSMMMEMRQRNLFIIIVLPTFFMLERYVALFRSKGLFHIYMKGNARGRWGYFGQSQKKELYLKGKKLLSYSYPKCKYKGRFMNTYTIDEKEYREKKSKALNAKSRLTKAETFKNQRDLLFLILNQELGLNQAEISKMCNKVGFKIARNTISEIITAREKELAKAQ